MDLVVTALSVQASRAEVIDYAEPYYNEYMAVLAKLPDPKVTKWRLYISPFKWQVSKAGPFFIHSYNVSISLSGKRSLSLLDFVAPLMHPC